MRSLLRRIARYLVAKLERYTWPDELALASMISMYCCTLELRMGEFVELAPVQGTCGHIQITGNANPVFSYVVFDKKLMDFIEVSVLVSKKNGFKFTSTVKAINKETEAKQIETKDAYKEPFLVLSNHLFRYFPFARTSGFGAPVPGKIMSKQEIQQLPEYDLDVKTKEALGITP